MKTFIALTAVFIALTPALIAADAARPLEAIHFSKIIPLLPAPPLGWKGEEPDGNTLDQAGVKMTTAGRTYKNGEGDDSPTVSVDIIDYVNNKQFYDATTAVWSTTQETPTGYMKTVKLGDYSGFEAFDKAAKAGQLWLVVAQRFFVHVETTNLDPVELQNWMKMIDLKKLAALK